MSPAATSPALPAAVSRSALRVVLFGMPDAGKTSLLGALAQAAQTQEHLLNGRLADLSQGLAALERRLYEETPRETLEEVVPYPVAFEPFGAGEGKGAGREDAVLVDCDGRVANDLLARRRSLGAGGDGGLARAVLAADALILAIDASAPEAQIDTDFAEFERFLGLLEHSRGRRTDVSGLPVFLVLTKCDLLARPEDTPATWMERIEERKRQVGRRFREFLARHGGADQAPFGRVNLHLWATAVKRPALAGTPSRPRDPFGVAELFRQGLESARAFRQRRRQSSRRLFWTVTGTTGLVGILIALAAALTFAHRPETTAGNLDMKIRSYQSLEGETPSEWLGEPLQPKINKLTELTQDPGFAGLPPPLQDYVHQRLDDLTEYRDYKARLDRIRLTDKDRVNDLDQLETRLNDDLAPPPQRREEWAQTDAALRRRTLLEDIGLLRNAVQEAADWYRGLIRQGEDLLTFATTRPGDASSWDEWQKKADLLNRKMFPHPEGEEVGSTGATYATVYHLDKVVAVQAEWEGVRQRLEGLRALILALGLAGRGPDGSLQPLDIPEDFKADQARADLEQLKKLYPGLPAEVPKLAVPEAIAEEVRRAAAARYDHLIEAGRQVVLEHLRQVCPEGLETAGCWRRLRAWLQAPEDLRDWRVLATLLARLKDPQALDPVEALDRFLQQDQFELEVQGLKLEIPYDLKVRPVGPLSVFLRHGGAAVQTLVCKLLDEEGQRDSQRRVTLYTFLPDSTRKLTYRPGDELWAEVTVKKEGDPSDWLLTWARSRSVVYQFERLVRPPRLHPKDQENLTGPLEEGIHLMIAPPNGVPAMPDLLPVVNLKNSP